MSPQERPPVEHVVFVSEPLHVYSCGAVFSNHEVQERCMSVQSVASGFVAAVLMFCSTLAMAQMAIPYGLSVSVDDAKKAAAPAMAEAKKNNWLMAVAVVDTSGNLVYYE